MCGLLWLTAWICRPMHATCAAIAVSARLRSQSDSRTECQLFAVHGAHLVEREDWSASSWQSPWEASTDLQSRDLDAMCAVDPGVDGAAIYGDGGHNP